MHGKGSQDSEHHVKVVNLEALVGYVDKPLQQQATVCARRTVKDLVCGPINPTMRNDARETERVCACVRLSCECVVVWLFVLPVVELVNEVADKGMIRLFCKLEEGENQISGGGERKTGVNLVVPLVLS